MPAPLRKAIKKRHLGLDAPQSKLLAALKRRFASPRDALRALGLDAALLDPPRSRLAYGPRLAVDGKPRLGRDQDEFDEVDLGSALRQALRQLPPEAVQALLDLDDIDAFKEMLADALEGKAAEGEEEALDEPPPFENGGRPRPGGEVDPVTGYRPNVAQDSFNRLYPSAARIGHSPFGSVDPAQREAIQQYRPRRIAAIAKDRAARKAPSFAQMYPDARRIKQAI